MSFRSRLVAGLTLGEAVRAADILAAVSKATARLAVCCLGADANRIHVIHEGCEDAFRPVDAATVRRIVVERYGLDPRGYLLTVSTIEPRKDYPTLLQAHDSIMDGPILAVVGTPGWRCRPVLESIKTRQVSGRVRYLGRVDDADLPALYSAARLTVYPSLYEGFGLPILEAMACGCPVLCTWTSSLPEVGGGAAHYFRNGDVQDLARTLRMLLSDQSTLADMRDRGLVQASRFSFSEAAKSVLSMVRDGVNRRCA